MKSEQTWIRYLKNHHKEEKDVQLKSEQTWIGYLKNHDESWKAYEDNHTWDWLYGKESLSDELKYIKLYGTFKRKAMWDLYLLGRDD